MFILFAKSVIELFIQGSFRVKSGNTTWVVVAGETNSGTSPDVYAVARAALYG